MTTSIPDTPNEIRWSPRHTLGIEQELHTVRRSDYQLVSGAPAVLGILRRIPRIAARVESEYMANTVELTTPISKTVASAVSFLRRLHGVACQAAEFFDLALSPIAIHPFAVPEEQEVTDGARYRAFLHHEALAGREQQYIGVHFHVGVPSGDYAVTAVDELSIYTPVFIALAASSPFHRGIDTGFESYRPLLGDRLAASGIAPHFDSWSDFVREFESLKSSGYINSLKDIWWDVRPSRWGTVELRIADGAATYRELGALAALAQCIVASVGRPEFHRRHLSRSQLSFNRFAALRYGLDAEVSLRAGEPIAPLRQHLDELVTRLLPIARDLGCEKELRSVLELAETGSSARRQRLIYGATRSLAEVVRAAVSELASSDTTSVRRIRGAVAEGVG